MGPVGWVDWISFGVGNAKDYLVEREMAGKRKGLATRLNLPGNRERISANCLATESA